MDFQGWDPGDQRITRSNWRFSSDNQWADSHYYDGYNGGWKQKEGRAQTDLSDLQRNLRGIGKSILAKRGESERSPISNQSRELSSHILPSRDLSDFGVYNKPSEDQGRMGESETRKMV
ncbi:hypothetical protein Bca4012_072412 [Brassica carinata]|uniref:Uncharacterized protein n=1 Tax=Brassica oleracea var. oleracea TaxID=109376 RepID=A0A0D3CG90_BRAOL